MKAIFKKYKPVLRFVFLFLGAYIVLTATYMIYLELSTGGKYPPDPITHLVAVQSNDLINNLGYSARILASAHEPTMELYVNGKFLARIIEGCNAVSIIILFISFIVAFSESLKKTLLFILAGVALIYAVNIVRIAALAVLLYKYPDREELLHSVVFPGLIYAMVFILWMIWIRMLNKKTTKNV